MTPEGAAPAGSPLKAVPIERTSKRLKAQALVANLAAIVGTVWVVTAVSLGTSSPAGIAIGVLLLVGGLVWSIVVRISIWWHHE